MDYLMADGVTSQWGTQVGEFPSSITDPAKRAALINLMGEFVERYKDEPTIYAWDMFNEPHINVWWGRVTLEEMQTFLKELILRVREKDQNHYVTVGGWTRYFMSEYYTNEQLGLVTENGINLYSFHYYSNQEAGTPPSIPATPFDYAASDIDVDYGVIISECQPEADAFNTLTAGEKLDLAYSNGYFGFMLWQDETYTITDADKAAIDAWRAENL